MKPPVVVADIARKSGDVVRISIAEYRGRRSIDIRIWYRGEDGELYPTRKGVRLDSQQSSTFERGVNRARRLVDEDEFDAPPSKKKIRQFQL